MFGFGNGAWDVAMNVQGVEVERVLGQPIMSRLHAMFSIGGMLGAGVTFGLLEIGVKPTSQLLTVGICLAVVRRAPGEGPMGLGADGRVARLRGERYGADPQALPVRVGPPADRPRAHAKVLTAAPDPAES